MDEVNRSITSITSVKDTIPAGYTAQCLTKISQAEEPNDLFIVVGESII